MLLTVEDKVHGSFWTCHLTGPCCRFREGGEEPTWHAELGICQPRMEASEDRASDGSVRVLLVPRESHHADPQQQTASAAPQMLSVAAPPAATAASQLMHQQHCTALLPLVRVHELHSLWGG